MPKEDQVEYELDPIEPFEAGGQVEEPNEDEAEVEIIDDTPAQDRNKKPLNKNPEPTEEELEAYSDGDIIFCVPFFTHFTVDGGAIAVYFTCCVYKGKSQKRTSVSHSIQNIQHSDVAGESRPLSPHLSISDCVIGPNSNWINIL